MLIEEMTGPSTRPSRLGEYAEPSVRVKTLTFYRLPETIRKFSHRKPIMIFCPTRASSVATAQELSRWWEGSKEADRYWNPPHHVVGVSNKDLQSE